jgi:hypothetical protein
LIDSSDLSEEDSQRAEFSRGIAWTFDFPGPTTDPGETSTLHLAPATLVQMVLIYSRSATVRPPAHIISSTAAALVLGGISGSPEMGVACLFSGILIDLDHVLDYLNRRGIRELGLRDFLRTTAWGPQGKLFLVLHAWEYLALILLASLVGAWRPWALGIFCGVALHLVLDQIYNHAHPLTYFMCYRLKCRFVYTCFFEDLSLSDRDQETSIALGPDQDCCEALPGQKRTPQSDSDGISGEVVTSAPVQARSRRIPFDCKA